MDVVAYKFNYLVTAHINSLDPTFTCFGPIVDTCFAPHIVDDDVTIVTSNHKRTTNIPINPPAQMLSGHAMLDSRTILPIAPLHSIADTGATSIFIMDGIDVENKRVAQRPLTIHLPDGRQVKSTHVCDIALPVLTGHANQQNLNQT